MGINRCVGCAKEIEEYPCPHCGFDAVTYQQPEYALPYNCVLRRRYLVGKVLGQGGFGLTYVGWDSVLGIRVAIKEYYPNGQVTRSESGTVLNWYSSPQAEDLRQNGMDSFLKEARKMARVEQIPEIVRVHDTFSENDTAYIIMDFVEGETLKSQLERSGVLSWEEALKIFIPAISAMAQVHQAGLVHRDLSPDNLMLHPDGSVSILDLGAAKDLSISNGASSMQVAKNGFSPIEQYTQRGGSGPWSDVYSLAASMYYSITGILPPSAIDRLEDDTISWDLPQLKALPPAALVAIQKAMAVLVKNRTQGMDVFLEQLQKAEKSRKKAPQKKEKPPKEKKSKPKREKEERPSEEQRKRSKVLRWIALVLAVAIAAYIVLSGLPSSAGKNDGDDGAAVGESNQAGSDGTTPTAPPQIAAVSAYHSLAAGENHGAALRSDGTVVAAGFNADGQCDVSGWTDLAAVFVGYNRTVGLKTDGTVVAAGANRFGQCNVGSWTNITNIYFAGNYKGECTLGLRADGTVVLAGSEKCEAWSNQMVELKVDDWTDIVDICPGYNYVLGLRSDGTVAATGSNEEGQCNVGDWENITDVKSSGHFTVGLKGDGTVVATGLNDKGQCDVSDWQDIVAIAAGFEYTAGLKKDGTMVFAGSDFYGKFDVSQWTDVVSLSGGWPNLVGLRSDGTLLVTGKGAVTQKDVDAWTDIVEVSVGGEYVHGLKADGTVVAAGKNNFKQCDVGSWTNIRVPAGQEVEKPKSDFKRHYQTIDASDVHAVAIQADGTVVAAGSNEWGQCDVSDWTDVVSVCASNGLYQDIGGKMHEWACTVGLRSDGTVLVAGDIMPMQSQQVDANDWNSIVSIAASGNHVVGLKENGTVVAVGQNMSGQCNVEKWENIAAISAGGVHTVGLKADGRVVAAGLKQFGACDVESWTDMVAVASGNHYTVGLKADGTVVTAGPDGYGETDVGGWTDIVAIAAGSAHTVGLKSDGTVVAIGLNENGQCDVDSWTDIVAIAAGDRGTMGLKSDGTILMAGIKEYDQSATGGWKNIRQPVKLPEPEKKDPFGSTMEISDFASYYFPGEMRGNPGSVGEMKLKFTVKGPGEVSEVWIADWFSTPPSQTTIDSTVRMMTDIWKEDGFSGGWKKPPFQSQQSHPVDSLEVGHTLYVLLIGLDQDGNAAGYAVVPEEVPES